MAPAVEAVDLSRSFRGETALDGLSIELPAGEVLALLGPNGAGKTTTVRLLNGVLAPDRGSSRVLGLDSQADATEVRRRTGVLTENAGLDDRLTAAENLEITARMRGLPRVAARERAGELLERFGMAGRAGSLVQGFSTGQRKRVALARALLHDPEVLFLDEPTSGLDPTATRAVVELIASLAAEEGRTVVLCTHFLGEAGRLAHRMAVLHRGRLRAWGRPDELAAGIWHGLDTAVDLGGPAPPEALAAIAATRGVLAVEASPDGALVKVEERAALPAVVAALVASGVPVYAAVPRPRTLEDVYFAIESQIASEEFAA